MEALSDMATQPMHEEHQRSTTRLIRLREVSHRAGYGKAMIYRLMREKRFPASVRLGPNSVAWTEESIDRWIESRIAESQSKGLL